MKCGLDDALSKTQRHFNHSASDKELARTKDSCRYRAGHLYKKKREVELVIGQLSLDGHSCALSELACVHELIGQQQQPPPAQRKMVASKKLMKVGPWGGAGGNPWDDGGHTGIRSITLSYDSRCVASISVEYDSNGLAVPAERHGGATGSLTTQIKLSFPDEHLTAVSGRYGPVAPGGSPVIRSLAFRTERGAYGPFGAAAAEGTPFEFAVEGGVVVGFCGRSGWQLDAVGMYVAVLRPEKVYDKVQKLGLMAYRSFMQRLGPAPAPAQSHDELEEQGRVQQHQNASVVQTSRKTS